MENAEKKYISPLDQPGEMVEIKNVTRKKLKNTLCDPNYSKFAPQIIAESKQKQVEIHGKRIKKYENYFHYVNNTSALHGNEYACVHNVREYTHDSKFIRIELVFCDADNLEIPQKYNGIEPKNMLDGEAIYRLIFNPERVSDELYEKMTGNSLQEKTDLERLRAKADTGFIELLKISLVHGMNPVISDDHKGKKQEYQSQYRMLIVSTLSQPYIHKLAKEHYIGLETINFSATATNIILTFPEQPDMRKTAGRERYELHTFKSGYSLKRGLSKAQLQLTNYLPELAEVSHDLLMILLEISELNDFDEQKQESVKAEIRACIEKIKNKIHPRYARAREVLNENLTLTDSKGRKNRGVVESRLRGPNRQIEQRKHAHIREAFRLHFHELLLQDLFISWEQRFQDMLHNAREGNIDGIKNILSLQKTNTLLNIEPFSTYIKIANTLLNRKDTSKFRDNLFWAFMCADIHFCMEKGFEMNDPNNPLNIQPLITALQRKLEHWNVAMVQMGDDHYKIINENMQEILLQAINILIEISTSKPDRIKILYKKLKEVAGTYSFFKVLKKEKK